MFFHGTHPDQLRCRVCPVCLPRSKTLRNGLCPPSKHQVVHQLCCAWPRSETCGAMHAAISAWDLALSGNGHIILLLKFFQEHAYYEIL